MKAKRLVYTTSNGTWKALERKVAKLLGGARNPLSGGASRHTRGDVIHDTLYVECKLRKRMAAWSLFRETEILAKREGKMPVVVLKEKGKKGELVVLRLTDFVELIKNAKEAKQEK